jgi:hypothetical protein
MGPTLYFPSEGGKEGVLLIFVAGIEPATFGSVGKHTNHSTTKATRVGRLMLISLVVKIHEEGSLTEQATATRSGVGYCKECVTQ